jgi:hypothetical protein
MIGHDMACLGMVRQIWRQFPWEFEFSEKLLLVLLYAQVN